MKSIALLIALLAAPCALALSAVTPSAMAQTTHGPAAPDVGLTQQAIASFGGPNMWVSPDLYLLGRPSKVYDNSALWFWSRAKGVFEVKLPDTARPELESLCTSNGALQWLSPTPKPARPGMYDAPVPGSRRVYRLSVDPATGAASVDDTATVVIGSIQHRASEVALPPSQRDTYWYLSFAGCRLVKVGDMLDAATRVAAESGQRLRGHGAYPYGLHVTVGPSTQDTAADFRNREQVYLDWSFHRISPDQAFAIPATPFGPLTAVDTAEESAPYALQLQVPGADGKPRAVFTAPSGHVLVTELSPDGCAVLAIPVKAERPVPNAPHPPPAPPARPSTRWPYGLGPASSYLPGVMIDLCSAESRALISKPS